MRATSTGGGDLGYDETPGLFSHYKEPTRGFTSVGVAGFEPTTSSTRTKRAPKLRHTPE